MKLISFARNGRIDCGVLGTEPDTLRVFDAHPVLGQMPPERRLFAVLAMTPEARRALAQDMVAAPAIARDSVTQLPAVPLCPLYLYNHANNPTVWKRQTARPWDVTRIPYPRVRPFSSFSGDGGEIRLPPGATVNGGAEFGIVIGRDAWRVPPSNAAAHIAGIVALNDGYTGGVIDEFVDTSNPAANANQKQGFDTLRKSADGNGGIGPWITTSEELEDTMRARLAPAVASRYEKVHCAGWLYDKTLRTWVDEQLCDEAHSCAYLFGAEWMIAWLSRFMRLPTGSVIGLGAAGWDGIAVPVAAAPDARAELTVDVQDVGAMRINVRRERPEEAASSPFAAARRQACLNPVPPVAERPGPALWVLRGNYPEAAETEGIPAGPGMNTLLYPSTALADSAPLLVLPPHATTMRCALHLAGVIGPAGAYRATPERLADVFSDIVLIMAVRDTSLLEPISNPTEYERRAAYFFGGCGDGFFRVGPPLPVAAIGDVQAQTMHLEIPGAGACEFRTSRYLNGLGPMCTLVSRLITLLPGDILSLGCAGPELEIPIDRPVAHLHAQASWGARLSLMIDDQRYPDARDTETR